MSGLRNYALVTGAYWGFTLTDGALRMLVLLHFYQLGFSPIEIALLFLLYELCGVITNLVGGWIGSHLGLKVTLFSGLSLQVVALAGLALLNPNWPAIQSVTFVMILQALSGIAKDLTKMSSKSAIKVLVPENSDQGLFKWVALTDRVQKCVKRNRFLSRRSTTCRLWLSSIIADYGRRPGCYSRRNSPVTSRSDWHVAEKN